MLGSRLATALTVIENGASEVLSEPSLAVMMMFDVVPAAVLDGVPESRPEALLKPAHDGLLAMDQISVWPSGSDPVG